MNVYNGSVHLYFVEKSYEIKYKKVNCAKYR